MKFRTRLIAIFVAATVLPLGITLWIAKSLLDESLNYASTKQLDEASQSLASVGKAYYHEVRTRLKHDAENGHIAPVEFSSKSRKAWPAEVTEFAVSADADRFTLTGDGGNTLNYLVRRGDDVLRYSIPLAGPGMRKLSEEHAAARRIINSHASHDLRRGFLYTFAVLAAGVWVCSLALAIYCAHRVTRPIGQLTAGLSELAAGNLAIRLHTATDDEIGDAMRAFNYSARELEHSRDRLVHLTRVATWQTIARKMAHEVKNSLTPIRLTMEEIVARGNENDPHFLEQAAQIVVDEVSTLEKRVRAFSEFASEPPVRLHSVEMNALAEERVAFLSSAHPEITYGMQLADGEIWATTDADLMKGVVTNLLENAADAAGPGGRVLLRTLAAQDGRIAIQVHDSGPGLSPSARASLFQPTISFKKSGMGLGLSIAHRSVLLSKGDIEVIAGDFSGAAFQVLLPVASPERRMEQSPSAEISGSAATDKAVPARFA